MLAAQVAGSGLADITKYCILKTMNNSKKNNEIEYMNKKPDLSIEPGLTKLLNLYSYSDENH